MNNKKIVFFTYHNWKTKRQGGFHKFAEIFLKKAYHVFFFSSPRPLYSFFKNDERLNRKSLIDLNKGVTFEKFNGLLENITIPTLDLPGIIKNRVNAKLDFYFMNFSLKNKSKYFLERFSDVHVFVFESCLGILYYPLIKKLFPSAKIFYRPSDPLIANRNLNPKIIEIEEKIIRECNKVILVNNESYSAYSKYIKDFDLLKNITILNNGVSLLEYTKKYNFPKEFINIINRVVYIGARDPEWDVIVNLASKDKHINYYIICPERPNQRFIEYTVDNSNIIYIPGIYPEEVPKYITNADVVIVPNPKNRYKNKTWGLTAKYLQAMAAEKPIISFHDDPKLIDYGIAVTYDENDFFNQIKKSLNEKVVRYSFDVTERDWEIIQEKFYKIVIDE